MLYELVPSAKTGDTATMLDEAIRYVRHLQEQVQVSLFCMILWYCIVLRSTAWHCIVNHGTAWYSTNPLDTPATSRTGESPLYGATVQYDPR